MANKMAEFPEKLAIFGQNLLKLALRGREGGGSRKSQNSGGGYFGNFRSQGGGILAIPPLGYPCYLDTNK